MIEPLCRIGVQAVDRLVRASSNGWDQAEARQDLLDVPRDRQPLVVILLRSLESFPYATSHPREVGETGRATRSRAQEQHDVPPPRRELLCQVDQDLLKIVL